MKKTQKNIDIRVMHSINFTLLISLIFYIGYLQYFFEFSLAELFEQLRPLIFYSIMSYYYVWYKHDVLISQEDHLLKARYKQLQNRQRNLMIFLGFCFLVVMLVR